MGRCAIMLCASCLTSGATAANADFNADGKSDILWRQDGAGDTSIWLMNGGTKLASVGGYTVGKDWSFRP